MRRLLPLALLLLLAGCGLTLDAVIDEDAGNRDAGAFDASSVDAGSVDAGSVDAGSVDAGSVDAGSVDASSVDAGQPMDANVLRDAGTDAGFPEDAGSDAGAPTDGGSLDAEAGDAGCDDSDGDRDGVSLCDGDCDDMDPLRSPDMVEVCDDGLDNNCDIDIDEAGCIGTHVSEEDGAVGATGSRADPLLTVAEALGHAKAIGPDTPIYVAAGEYDETVRIEETHSVLCGHDPLTWARDPELYETTLTAVDAGGHQFIAGSQPSAQLDGCTLHGIDASTGTVTVAFEAGANGTLSHNTITAADASGAASGAVVVHPEGIVDSAAVNTGVRPQILDNRIILGASLGDEADRIDRGSYGVAVVASNVRVEENTVSMVPGATTRVAGIVFVRTPASATAFNNEVFGGPSVTRAAGISVRDGSGIIARNRVFSPGSAGDSVGMLITGNVGQIEVENNVFYGGPAGGRSGGLLIRPDGLAPSSGRLSVHSNFLSGGSEGVPAFGIGWEMGSGSGAVGAIGRVRSNILYAGGGPDAHAAWQSAFALGPSQFDFNALSGAAPNALYALPVTSVANVDALNALSAAFSDNVFDDCGLTSTGPSGDHLLMLGSNCIDAGNGAEGPPSDFEGQPRPAAVLLYDIGPDELL